MASTYQKYSMNLMPARNPLAYPAKGNTMTADSNPKLQVTPTAYSRSVDY